MPQAIVMQKKHIKQVKGNSDMAIKPPGWCRGAVPILNGWKDPNTNELLVSGRHTQDQIDEFHGVPSIKEVLIEAMPEPVEDTEEDEYWTPEDLHGMSKVELEELGREFGIELDRRQNKQALIEELEAVMFD